MKFFFNKRTNGQAPVAEVAEQEALAGPDTTESELAAVAALAIHAYITEMASYENTVITMQKFMKPYSPWNSKLYGLRQQPLHIPRRPAKI